jgi:D-alanine-D-alanine ligase
MTIGIIFGGKSYEHEISIISCVVLNNVLKYDLKFIFVDMDNNFYLIEKSNLNAKYFSSMKYKKSKKLLLDNDGFGYKTLFSNKVIQYDFLINLIHGAFGEDGSASAFLDFYNQYYIGPRLDASVLSYNKYLTKMYANSIDVKTLEYEVCNKNTINISTNINFPVIVKPCRGGSSMGVHIAKNKTDFDYYIQEAFEYDDDVLIEPFIKNVKEYNLAGCFGDNMIYSNIEEPEKNDILDFETKYMDFSRDEKISCADIPDELKTKLQEAFNKIYNPIFKGAIIRCDFFVIDDKVYLNEINPIPGSMAHYLFDDFNEVVKSIFHSLSKTKNINIKYDYIDNINKAKG